MFAKWFVTCLVLTAAGSEASENSTSSLHFSEDDIQIVIDSSTEITLRLSEPLQHPAIVRFLYQIGNDITYVEERELIVPLDNVTFLNGTVQPVSLNITAIDVGHLVVGVNSSSDELEDLEDAFVHIDIVHSKALVIVSAVIGWIYFVAWSISFYPQVYINWKRKSVIGLNFDFLSYNLTGFLAYGFFNVGMFWVTGVKQQYKKEHPYGINPVQLNDVIFTIHAVWATLITIIQCFIYERGGQRISRVAMVIVTGSWLFAAVSLFVTIGGVITWLQYLYYFSYIKLGVTLIKYVPQAYMNFRRKSTEGWSIGNVLLDFTGGSLSIVQMMLLAYNSDDWSSIFGDPTKFGLGFFSILFDILFIIQHYVLYRPKVEGYLPINPDKAYMR